MKNIPHLILTAVIIVAGFSCVSHKKSVSKSEFISGEVTSIQAGKDGYTATMVTPDKQVYLATVSRANLTDPKQYVTVNMGATISLKGDHWEMDNQHHITVRELNTSIQNETNCYKGKLVVRGICRQRVITLLSSNTGKIAVEQEWNNPDDGKMYKNVFSVSNICDFPESIKEGDTISFKPVIARKSECMVCMAYIPVPDSVQAIEVGCDTLKGN